MSDFKRSGHLKATGTCIWMDCEEPAVMVLDCTKRPVQMSVCAVHGKIFLEDAQIVPETDGVSIRTIVDVDEEVN